METTNLAASPFAVLTFIAAPAILTNASSVLVMSTINRMLRTRDRMQTLYEQSRDNSYPDGSAMLLRQVARVEVQGLKLLSALRATYIALAGFAGATLVTLVGASVSTLASGAWVWASIALGLVLGAVGVTGLILGSVYLLQATQLSMANIREEAAAVRQRQQERATRGAIDGPSPGLSPVQEVRLP